MPTSDEQLVVEHVEHVEHVEPRYRVLAEHRAASYVRRFLLLDAVTHAEANTYVAQLTPCCDGCALVVESLDDDPFFTERQASADVVDWHVIVHYRMSAHVEIHGDANNAHVTLTSSSLRAEYMVRAHAYGIEDAARTGVMRLIHEQHGANATHADVKRIDNVDRAERTEKRAATSDAPSLWDN